MAIKQPKELNNLEDIPGALLISKVVNSYGISIGVVFIIIIVLIMLLIYYNTKKIVKPLEEITAVSKQISKNIGSDNIFAGVKLPTQQTGIHETQELQNKFKAMVSTLSNKSTLAKSNVNPFYGKGNVWSSYETQNGLKDLTGLTGLSSPSPIIFSASTVITTPDVSSPPPYEETKIA